MSQSLDTPQPNATAAAGASEFQPPSAWTMQYRVLKAIVLRNMTNQHGDSRLGYFLAIILPLISLGIMFLLFGLRGRLSSPTLPLAVFLVTGYPVWMAFSGMYGRTVQSATKVDSLLAFPQINQLDLILATAIIQFTTNTITFVVLVVIASIFGHLPPDNPAGVMLLYWAITWLGLGLGLILCGMNRVLPMVAQFVNMFMRVIMWFSGIIYSVDRLPPSFWPYLKWNPLLHAIEGMRQCWIPTYHAPVFSPTFLISVGFIMTMLGLALERATRRFVGL